MIHIKNINKNYYKRCVLDIKEFTFKKGKSYAILGANGSGKSTLLRILSGLIKHDNGTIEMDSSLDIGYLPQSPYIFGVSVIKNIEIIGKSKYRNKLEDGEILDFKRNTIEILKSIGLEELKDLRGDMLSGGEAQRLAFGRVIALPHDIIILDEPTTSMDILGIDMIEKALKTYMKKNNCTVIFTTHLLAQAFRLADEIVFLDKGKIIEVGSAENILYHPKSDYVKTFLKTSETQEKNRAKCKNPF